MSNYNKFGFFKNKFNVAIEQEYNDFYPQYPNLPDATKLYSTLRKAYVQNANAVSNVNTTYSGVFPTSRAADNQQYTMPDGNVAFPVCNTAVFYDEFNNRYDESMELFKYNADTGNISQLSITKTSRRNDGSSAPQNPDFRTKYIKTGCLCYDNKVRIFDSEVTNIKWWELSTDYTTFTSVYNHTANPAPVITEDSYPQLAKVLALTDTNKVLMIPRRGYFGLTDQSRFTMLDLTTEKFANISLTHDNAASSTNITYENILAVQVPGTGSGNTANVYIIPGQGLIEGGTDSGNVPNLAGPRVISEYDPGSNVTTRFTPTGANLTSTTGTMDHADSLYGGATLGVDGNVYCFPGKRRKDIMVLDASNRSAVQSTFNIFNMDIENPDGFTENTIEAGRSTAITAPDGFAYIRATGRQYNVFGNSEVDFWIGIDTNPVSDTYQTGYLKAIDPNNNITDSVEPKGYVFAKDGLVIHQPQDGGAGHTVTLQISGEGLLNQAIYPALLNNMNT